MNAIDAIQNVIQLIDADRPDEAATQLQALVLHLDSIVSEQRLSYALLQAFVTNTERAHAKNRMLTQQMRLQHKSEISGAKKALANLKPAERQEIEQLSLMEV